MKLLVSSTEDLASTNIKEALLLHNGWKELDKFEGKPVYSFGEMVMVTIDGMHLHADNIDKHVTEVLGSEVEQVIFLSRHRAASGQRSLTVHPIGNWNRADYGGKDGELVKSAPDLMTSLLRELKRRASGLEFEVAFEVTHHGPWLETPTLFIEIGSSEATWGDKDAAKAIADTLLNVRVGKAPHAIGVGGGHYAPRFTEVSLAKKISFGHMLPNYALDLSNIDDLSAKITKGLVQSDAELVYLHKKSMKRSEATMVTKLVSDLGYKVVDSSDLEDLSTQ
jgi:D-aminoacyl-tRNA deacylase